MKLEWNNNSADIGSYELTLTTEEGYKHSIHVWDYTCPYYQQEKEKNPREFEYYHSHDYKVHYCHGYSMTQEFDKPMTLEEVKIWAEDYLLDGFIRHYEETIEELPNIKKRAEQARAIKNSRR